MKDKDSNIIYVGKSKNLKNRVSQYFTPSYNPSKKITRMISFIKDIEIIYTDTELDALLLECELIKKIQPMYNTLMKNDKKYSYIKINIKEEYPSIEVVNNINDNSLYFGPYMSSSKLEDVTNTLTKTFKLRKCKSSNKLKGCLNYDLGICMGPCRNKDKKAYNNALEKLINTLKGNDTDIIDVLSDKMQISIKNLNFEEAQKHKADIDNIKTIMHKSKTINFISENYNLLVITKVNSDDFKLYLLRGVHIKYTKILSTGLIKNTEKIQSVINDLKSYYDFGYSECTDTVIKKDNLDVCNIIYNYIKYNNDCSYILINKNTKDEEVFKWILDFI